jgi:ankyrin repeat protein
MLNALERVMPLVEWQPTKKEEKLKELIKRLSTNREALDKRMIECLQFGNMKEAKAMLLGGANPNATNIIGWSALMLASSIGDTEFVGLLLERNADVNHRSAHGLTTLMVAAPEAMELLRRAAGGDVFPAVNNR